MKHAASMRIRTTIERFFLIIYLYSTLFSIFILFFFLFLNNAIDKWRNVISRSRVWNTFDLGIASSISFAVFVTINRRINGVEANKFGEPTW